MDKINVAGMEFWGYHGALPEETKLGQRFRIDVTLCLSLQQAGLTDNLSKTVNYAEVYEACKQIVEGTPVKLIETIAETIAARLLEQFSAVQECTIQVIKPDPPIPGHYTHVAVEITRGRGE